MLIEIKNRKQISNTISKKLAKENISKVEMAKQTGLSRNSIYQILQSKGKDQNFSIDNLFKVCKQLGIKLILDF